MTFFRWIQRCLMEEAASLNVGENLVQSLLHDPDNPPDCPPPSDEHPNDSDAAPSFLSKFDFPPQS